MPVDASKVLADTAIVKDTASHTRPFHGAGSSMTMPPVFDDVGAVTVK